MLLPFVNNAQNYYAPSDINVSWRVWDKSAFDWVIQNGHKINVAVNPAIIYSRNSLSSVSEVCLTYIKNNKILALTFSKSEGIRLFTENNAYKLSDFYSPLSTISQLSWYNVDFENIVYSDVLNWLIIPCGNSEQGYNGIAIMFNSTNSINDVYLGDDGDYRERTYNLNGVEVDEAAARGQILIKYDGKNAVKVLNK